MSLRLYDSMSRIIREIQPLDGQVYRFYCCGPTVYGPAHIGNFRTFVLQDVFRRVVELSGLPTVHVRNITDVDDKTIRKSREEGKSLADFAAHWTAKFHADCRALNLLPPHVEPSAVAHIPQQVAMIESLVSKGHAYQAADGSVYFKIASFPGYGRLSRVHERELKLGATVASDEYEDEKEGLADFALWKGRKPEDGENFWPSPWGEGRPGWHLECSAMSLQYLGESFDLHSGGVDLVFPHHENEIAQSECCSGKTFAEHWFHITHLLVDGRKMAKSEGNFHTLEDLVAKGFSAAELRYTYLSGHYRKPLNFTFDSMLASRQALARMAKFSRALVEKAGDPPAPSYEELLGLKDLGPFQAAWAGLCQDLNTPEALGQIFTAIKTIAPETRSSESSRQYLRQFHFLLAALGLKLPAPEEAANAQAPEEIHALATQRWQAKQDRDWSRADALRQQIADAGWILTDTKEGFSLTPKH